MQRLAVLFAGCALAGNFASAVFADAPVLNSSSGQVRKCDGNFHSQLLTSIATDTGTPSISLTVRDAAHGLNAGPTFPTPSSDWPRAVSTNAPGLVALWSFDNATVGSFLAADELLSVNTIDSNGAITSYYQCTSPQAVNCQGVSGAGATIFPYMTEPIQAQNTILRGNCSYANKTYYGRATNPNDDPDSGNFTATDVSGDVVFVHTSFDFYPLSDKSLWNEVYETNSSECVWYSKASISGPYAYVWNYDAGCNHHPLVDFYNCQVPTLVPDTLGNLHGISFAAGQNQYASVNGPGYTLTSFSLTAWVNPSAVNAGSNNAILGQGAGGHDAYVGIDGTTGKFIFWLNSYTSTNTVSSNTQATPGTWYHLVATYDSATQTASLYVYGLLENSAGITGSPSTATPFILGARDAASGSPTDYFSGTVAQAAVFNRALPAAEAAAYYDPLVMQFSENGAPGLNAPSSYCFGPGSSCFGQPNASVTSNGTYGMTTAMTITANNLPMQYGSNNSLNFIAQDTRGYVATFPFTATVTTVAPFSPEQNGGSFTAPPPSATTSSVYWTWTEPYICNPHDFNVFQTVNPGSDNTGTTTNYRQNGLGPNQPAGLQVQAQTMYGDSPLTSVVTGYSLAAVPTLLLPPWAAVPTPTQPPPVVYLTSMTVAWNPNLNPSYTRYELNRSINDPGFGVGTSTPIAFASMDTSTQKAFTALNPETTYYFRVRAKNGNGPYPGGGEITDYDLKPIPTLAYSPYPIKTSTVSVNSILWYWPHEPTSQGYALAPADGTSPFYCTIVDESFDWATGHGSCAGIAGVSLTPNQFMGLRLRTVNLSGSGPLSAAVTAYTLANAPSGLHVISVSTTSMLFTWDANGNAPYTPHELTQSLNDPDFGPAAVKVPITFANLHTETTALVTGMSPSSTYYFRIRAQNGNGGYPGGGQATSFDISTAIPTLPIPPATINAVDITTDSIRWTWPHVPTAQYYTLYSAEGDNVYCNNLVGESFDWKTQHDSCPGLAGMTLGANDRRGIRIRTTNNSGSSIISQNSAYAFTLARAPLSLAVTSVSSNTVSLSWDTDSNPTYTNYQMVASFDPSFPPVATSTRTFTGSTGAFSGLLPGTPYYFRVRAVNGDGIPTEPTAVLSSLSSMPASQGQESIPPHNTTPITVTGPDGRTQLDVPADALASGATVFLSVDPANEPVSMDRSRLQRTLSLSPPQDPDLAYAPGTAREFVALVGYQPSTSPFREAVTLKLPYSDSMSPGIVNDSDPPIAVGTLKAFSLNPYLDRWDSVDSSFLDTSNKCVQAKTTHFSVFALFGRPLAHITDMSQVKVYPQPWQPASGGKFDSVVGRIGATGLLFENLPADSTVKIYTLTGQLVDTLQSALDSNVCACHVAVWDGLNSAGKKVASGVYFARIAGANQEKTVKIAVEK